MIFCAHLSVIRSLYINSMSPMSSSNATILNLTAFIYFLISSSIFIRWISYSSYSNLLALFSYHFKFPDLSFIIYESKRICIPWIYDFIEGNVESSLFLGKLETFLSVIVIMLDLFNYFVARWDDLNKSESSTIFFSIKSKAYSKKEVKD